MSTSPTRTVTKRADRVEVGDSIGGRAVTGIDAASGRFTFRRSGADPVIVVGASSPVRVEPPAARL